MLTPFKMGVGGPIGSGKHWMSWVHNEDLVGTFLVPLDNASASGPLNGTAPNPVTNKEFSKAMGRALSRPAFLPTPVFGLKAMLGKVADVIATGQRGLPKRTQELGYQYKFPVLDAALADVLREIRAATVRERCQRSLTVAAPYNVPMTEPWYQDGLRFTCTRCGNCCTGRARASSGSTTRKSRPSRLFEAKPSSKPMPIIHPARTAATDLREMAQRRLCFLRSGQGMHDLSRSAAAVPDLAVLG